MLFALIFCALLTFNFLSCSIAFAQNDLTAEQYEEDFDFLWKTFRTDYAYFDEKRTDWDRVNEIYRPAVRTISTKSEFVALLEKVLEELYDDHIHLNTHTPSSPNIVPSRTDVWAEWIDGRAIVTGIRPGFPAEFAGLRPGMEILGFNGMSIEDAVRKRMGRAIVEVDDEIRGWTLRKVLAGYRNEIRTIEVEFQGEATPVSIPFDAFDAVYDSQHEIRLDFRTLDPRVGYMIINSTLAGGRLPDLFDFALEELRDTNGLILDLRKVGGGNTGGVEGIIGRLIDRERVYQRTVPRKGEPFLSRVRPRGEWRYKQPLVVLVNRWTGSAGEGLAISLDALDRATVVGTKMAGLEGSVLTMRMPNSGIGFQCTNQRIFNGTLKGDPAPQEFVGSSRSAYVPSVLVDTLTDAWGESEDPILEKGLEVLGKLMN
ncbi:MAG: S41 family peptidase [Gemmatimonadota bacterium]|nr:S41 family peptidase [Gemmatimonadota bacterium]